MITTFGKKTFNLILKCYNIFFLSQISAKMEFGEEY